MIGEILQAVMDECKEFLKEQGGTFILKTDFKSSQLASYNMPLLLFDLVAAPETYQWLGGGTRMEWLFGFNAYNLAPNPMNDADEGYSTSLLNNLDALRRHFSKGLWLTPGMTTIREQYCFKFTLSGVQPGDSLPVEDGLTMGYRIIFDSLSIDTDTKAVQESTSVLEEVEQIDYPYPPVPGP